MTNFVTHSRESLIFRDGRPFGDAGHVNGGTLQWPMPSTIIGMLRNRIGISRDPHFFLGSNREENIQSIQQITACRIVPLWQEKDHEGWTHLFPVPADALVTNSTVSGSYDIHYFSLEKPNDDEGVDLPWNNWLIPTSAVREKPARDCPDLWFQDIFFRWLENGNISGSISSRDLGVSWPLADLRMHTAIDASGTAKNHQLFSSQGIRFEARQSETQAGGRYGIGVELTGLGPDDDPTGPCRLGGERKTAQVDLLDASFPDCPDWFADDHFLRLILVSPGNFGSWAPDWLRPDPEDTETPWRTPPGSNIELRLVSAFVPRWQPVSGWDLDKKEPRATRKLVPPGSVYVIELRDPQRSPDLARLFWGKTLADTNSNTDGYGCACVGKLEL